MFFIHILKHEIVINFDYGLQMTIDEKVNQYFVLNAHNIENN
jgi:hypothetical protein